MDINLGAFWGISAGLIIFFFIIHILLIRNKMIPEGSEYLVGILFVTIALSLHSFFASAVYYANTQRAISDFNQKLSNMENSA